MSISGRVFGLYMTHHTGKVKANALIIEGMGEMLQELTPSNPMGPIYKKMGPTMSEEIIPEMEQLAIECMRGECGARKGLRRLFGLIKEGYHLGQRMEAGEDPPEYNPNEWICFGTLHRTDGPAIECD